MAESSRDTTLLITLVYDFMFEWRGGAQVASVRKYCKWEKITFSDPNESFYCLNES